MQKYLKIVMFLIVIHTTLLGFTLQKYSEFHFVKLHQNVYVMHGPVMAPNVENEGFMNNPAIIE
ncbi:MAG TPA: MBL fold metallo-hydrolase, partial [Campylobacteraceae bacterium]|nr:MBL fold metallo-hydrolase [Campylobacteraceae bacterium]